MSGSLKALSKAKKEPVVAKSEPKSTEVSKHAKNGDKDIDVGTLPTPDAKPTSLTEKDREVLEVINEATKSTASAPITKEEINFDDITYETPKELPKPKTKEEITKKQEQLERSVQAFNPSEYPLIVMVWGYDGTSKSEQILKFRDKNGKATLVFDLENKLLPQASRLGFPLENLIVSKKYDTKYSGDGPATLGSLREYLERLRIKLQKKERYIERNIEGKTVKVEFSAIAIDGISDLRPYAVDEWLQETGRKAPMTPGDWSDINDKVREICFTMINMGVDEHLHIFFTAQIGGEYVKNVRTKLVPGCKEWIWFNVHHKFMLTRDDENHKFFAYCEKSNFYDPFFTIDLTDFTRTKPSLFNILQQPELLEKFKKEYENYIDSNKIIK